VVKGYYSKSTSSKPNSKTNSRPLSSNPSTNNIGVAEKEKIRAEPTQKLSTKSVAVKVEN